MNIKELFIKLWISYNYIFIEIFLKAGGYFISKITTPLLLISVQNYVLVVHT